MKKILILGLATLLFFGIGGYLIIEFVQQKNFISILTEGWPIYWQILTGIAYGCICAGIALFIINRKFFESEKEFYRRKIGTLELNYPRIIFISLCAGIGEEIFFRAAIQPLLGVWITSFIFVAIHGYINPSNWKISIYGITLTILIAGLGYLFIYTGLITAITAHTVLDIILLREVLVKPREQQNELT